MTSISTMPLTDRLLIVLRRTIPLVPGDVGDHLREMLSPKAVAVMATVAAIWAASHFVGIGEIADAFLLATGLLAVGTSGLEGCKKLLSFGITTANAKTDADLTRAAQDLAKASTILGIDVVLALIFHGRPKNTFKTMAKGHTMPTYKQFKSAMPKGRPTRMYEAKLTITKSRLAGSGGTNPRNTATVGRDFYSAEGRSSVAFREVKKTVYHERFHQRLNQGFSLLGRPALYVKMGAYKRSYILRYLEEVGAEMSGLIAVRASRDEKLLAFKFPNDAKYGVTWATAGQEVAGILLGPVNVGGVLYRAYHGVIKNDD